MILGDKAIEKNIMHWSYIQQTRKIKDTSKICYIFFYVYIRLSYLWSNFNFLRAFD